MVEAAGESDRLYAVMQNRRYDANIRSLCGFIASGAIGRVTTVHCDFFVGAHFGGFRDHMRHVLLLDMAIHTFDAARLITGNAYGTASGDPVGVYCKEWNPPGSWYDHDASARHLRYDGDVITVSWQLVRQGLSDQGVRLAVIGMGENPLGRVMIQAQVAEERALAYDATSNCRREAKTDGHAGCIRDFVRCVQTGDAPETICTDNIKSLGMVFGAIESAEQQKYISINAI
jgi:predicted dehydrogenase